MATSLLVWKRMFKYIIYAFIIDPLLTCSCRGFPPCRCIGTSSFHLHGGSNNGRGVVNQFCDKLKATKLESEEIIVKLELVEEVLSREKKYQLVKLLSSKYYNREAFKSTMKKIWRLIKPLRFFEMGGGWMMAKLEDYINKQRVVRDGPWNFDKCLVLVKDFDGKQEVKTSWMTEAAFWIQIHELPFMAQNEYIGRLVGSSLGRLEEVDIEEGEWGEFMRIRVHIDITKPLICCKKINIGMSEPI